MILQPYGAHLLWFESQKSIFQQKKSSVVPRVVMLNVISSSIPSKRNRSCAIYPIAMFIDRTEKRQNEDAETKQGRQGIKGRSKHT